MVYGVVIAVLQITDFTFYSVRTTCIKLVLMIMMYLGHRGHLTPAIFSSF